jgi:hypothetical protein
MFNTSAFTKAGPGPNPRQLEQTLPSRLHGRAHGFASPLSAAPVDGGGEGNPDVFAPISSLGQGFLFLTGAVLGRDDDGSSSSLSSALRSFSS